MQEFVSKPVLACLLLSVSFVTTAHASEFNRLNALVALNGNSIFAIEADPNQEVPYTLADETQLPYSHELRENYAVSLAGGKGALISPSWVLTSSQVISWDAQKHPEQLSLSFAEQNGVEYRGEKVFRHPYKDLALVLLQSPIVNSREPVLLMMDALEKDHGEVGIKKIVSSEQDGHILAVGASNQSIIPGEGYESKGGDMSGSPWAIESALVGDVLVGVGDASGKAPQVAYARKWIQQIVSTNTPDETLYWASFAQALPDHTASQPQEESEQVEALEPVEPLAEPVKRTLIILP